MPSLPLIPRARWSAPLTAILRSRAVAALTTPHSVDRYLELLDPTFTVHERRARLVAVTRQTPRSVTLTLQPGFAFETHRPGQFVELGYELDGVRRTRCFSIASSAHRRDGLIELTITERDGGLVTPALVHAAETGTLLTLSEPKGDFTLPDVRPERLLFVSGGSGITPVLSMLRTLLDEGYQGSLTFLHYARGPEDFLYSTELALLRIRASDRLKVVIAYTRAAGADLEGRFCRAHLDAAVPDFASRETFVCGPEAMMTLVREAYVDAGAAERLHEERYALPTQVPTAADDAAAGQLHFTQTGRSVAGNGLTLLEQAEAAGLSPAFGCRMGICKTCVCTKVSGVVRDVRTGALDREAGSSIQLCVSQPVGDVTLEL